MQQGAEACVWHASVSDCNHRFAAELPITIHWPNALVLVIV